MPVADDHVLIVPVSGPTLRSRRTWRDLAIQ
jgi:hypothetical protein